jgi:transcriptional regulator with XRE-family HTH domain
MRLRVPELLKQRGMTAYELSKKSDGRIGMNTAYRLARGEWKALSEEVLDALCDVFGIDDPGPLFERDGPARRRRKPADH